VNIDRETVEKRLGFKLPEAYCEFVARSERCEPYLESDLKRVLIENLQLRMTPRPAAFAGKPWPASFLCIGNDGCGNNYAIDVDAPQAGVWFFDHEADEFEIVAAGLAEFVQQMAPLASIDYRANGSLPLQSDNHVIARTELPEESVLAPITLEEWKSLVDCDDQLEWIEFDERKHPFNAEVIRIPVYGLARVRSGTESKNLQWGFGRIWNRRGGLETVEKMKVIASILEARFFPAG